MFNPILRHGGGLDAGQGAALKLAVGDEVWFSIHPGEGAKGPQARNVVATGKDHLVRDDFE